MLIADRLAEYERTAGPVRYHGGPVDWETGRPLRQPGEPYVTPPTYYPADEDRVPPKFPTLQEQSEWLTAEDIAFCRAYARDNWGRP